MHVVVAGGGVAGLETIMALRDLAGGRVRITLVAPGDEFVYRPLAVGEPFAQGAAGRLPLAGVARDFDVDLVRDAVATVSPSARVVRLASGTELAYDRLVVALGARAHAAFRDVLTFRGPEDSEAMHGLIQDLEAEHVRRVAFVVPTGTVWSLPLYELALMTAHRAWDMDLDVALTAITPEDRPLAVFGPGPSREAADLLTHSGVEVRAGVHAEVRRPGLIVVHPGGEAVECDRIVALPRLRGPALRSLPYDEDGFIPIDNHGRVAGVEDVFAAGDGTNFPVKQGGIACQQADAVAEVIAKAAGTQLEPRSFRPVLRGQLLTGGKPRFMRTNISGREGDVTQSGAGALWWPSTKVAGRYLGPYLHSVGADRSATRS
jgi:sulfide:quinone oxidoreductase